MPHKTAYYNNAHGEINFSEIGCTYHLWSSSVASKSTFSDPFNSKCNFLLSKTKGWKLPAQIFIMHLWHQLALKKHSDGLSVNESEICWLNFPLKLNLLKKKTRKQKKRGCMLCFALHRAFGNLPDLLFLFI